MWKDFQKILEKRVDNQKNIKNDKYLIIKTSEQVLFDFFGKMGKNFIEIRDYKEGRLWIIFKNSTWRSEFNLHQKMIIEEINKKLNQNLIKTITLI